MDSRRRRTVSHPCAHLPSGTAAQDRGALRRSVACAARTREVRTRLPRNPEGVALFHASALVAAPLGTVRARALHDQPSACPGVEPFRWLWAVRHRTARPLAPETG